MSQAKVDRYKEEKANRKQIIAKQKKKSMIAKICACLVALALVAWLGYSVYDMATRPPTSDMELTVSALDTYFDNLEADEEETEDTEESEDTEDTEDSDEAEESEDTEDSEETEDSDEEADSEETEEEDTEE